MSEIFIGPGFYLYIYNIIFQPNSFENEKDLLTEPLLIKPELTEFRDLELYEEYNKIIMKIKFENVNFFNK